MSSNIQNEIEGAIQLGDTEKVLRIIASAKDRGLTYEEVFQSMTRGVEKVRKGIMSEAASIPELILALEAMKKGAAFLKEKSPEAFVNNKPEKVVIGVVRGDPHELGKSIIAGVYEAFGYDVYDLGVSVSCDDFVNEVIKRQAEILALSSMMTTTMEEISEIAEKAKKAQPNICILAGGAALDEFLAKQLGADGYAESALTVIEETKKSMSEIARAIPVSNLTDSTTIKEPVWVRPIKRDQK